MSETQNKLLKAAISLAAAGVVFFLPFASWGIQLSPIEIRVIAMFVMAALFWILEPIPIWTTSVMVITLSLLCVSNGSLSFLMPERYDKAAVSSILDDAIGKGINPEIVGKLKENVENRLNKKTKLDAEEVRMTLGFQLMDAYEKIDLNAQELSREGKTEEAAGQESIAAQLKTAAGRLYSKEITARIQGLQFVNTMQQKSTMATFADPIIMLFLGGFFLAAAATKYRLDMNLAKVLLKPFGTNPKFVLLGLMSVTALFSMFMSNTATAAMMLAILTPVLALFTPEDKGRAAFALAIPIAANLGGIGTPIGTPPNAIALKALQGMGLDVSFGKWLMFGIPFVIVMILIAWLLLLWLFPISQKKLELQVGGKFLRTPKAIIVYVTFAVGNGQGSTRAGFQYHRHDSHRRLCHYGNHHQGRLEENGLGRALAGSRRLCPGAGPARHRTGKKPDRLHSLCRMVPLPAHGGYGNHLPVHGHLHEPYGYGLPAHSDYRRCRRQHG